MRLGPQALCLDESFVQRSCGLVAGDFVGMAGRAAGASIACSLVLGAMCRWGWESDYSGSGVPKVPGDMYWGQGRERRGG